jgi:hypothetical protein
MAKRLPREIELVHNVKALAALVALGQMRDRQNNHGDVATCALVVDELARMFLYRDAQSETDSEKHECEEDFHAWRAAEMLGLNKQKKSLVPSLADCQKFREMWTSAE